MNSARVEWARSIVPVTIGLEREVAIKILVTHFHTEANGRERLLKEVMYTWPLRMGNPPDPSNLGLTR